jgi:hypothetical protein
MPIPGREIAGWTAEFWQSVQRAVQKALAGTAKCRQVIPKGPDLIGQMSVTIPTVGAAFPVAYGPDAIVTPVQIYVDVTLDDRHAENEADIIRLMSAAAAVLGGLEDLEIVQGAPAAAPAAGPPPPFGRIPRSPGLVRAAAQAPAGAPAPVSFGAAAGAAPTLDELFTAVTNAVAQLEIAGRPGQFGLLLHNTLMALLRQPRFLGGVPLLQEVEGLIGGNKVAGTNALDGTFARRQIGAILFRLEPPAMDIVYTRLPTVTVLARAAGSTLLRVEQDIVLRILEPAAIQPIAY